MSNKRLNYFRGQFLNEDDFKDEQSYHINALSMHNKNLHSWGIASGLDIKYDKGKKYVTLENGMAVDREGRQILLEKPVDIDLSNAGETIVFLTIALKVTETDPAEEGDSKENTRITEEPLIELDKIMPDETSHKVFLAKIILNPRNKSVEAVNKEGRKVIGFSEEIKTNSIKFILPMNEEDWPGIKGTEGSGIEIRSQNTAISGNLEVKGKLKGKLEKNTVGMEQIKAISNSFSDSIAAKKEKEVASEWGDISNPHLFFLTSVIPTTSGSIKWWWQTEMENNKLKYALYLKNLSDTEVSYDIKYYGISEE